MGGGPGIRVQQFGGGRPRRRAQHQANGTAAPPEQSLSQAIQSLLPLLLLLLLPLLSSIFSGFGSTNNTVPAFRFDAVHPYSQHHLTDRLKIPYWVNPSETADYSAKKWRELDKNAERTYLSNMSVMCDRERNERDRMAQEAQGFFFTDQEMLQKAMKMELKSCKRLSELGVRY